MWFSRISRFRRVPYEVGRGGGEGGLLGSGMTVVGSGLGGFGPIV